MLDEDKERSVEATLRLGPILKGAGGGACCHKRVL